MRKARPLAERFWENVDKNGPVMPGMSTPCWIWAGYRKRSGYGEVLVGSRADGTRRREKAHRVGWNLVNGPVPSGKMVLHHCDNRACIRADVDPAVSHTFLGVHVENMADMRDKGRRSGKGSRPGESNGAARLTPAQVDEIRARYAAGGIAQRALAGEFGISQTQVGRIVRGARWRRVA